jgi:putative transposase
LDGLSREMQVTAATLSEGREALLVGGQANLKSRQPDARDEEILRLKAGVGEVTLRNEVLREANRRLKENLPLARRRSSP